MADSEGSSEQDDVSFLRTEDMVCLSSTAIGERVCLAAEGFGNRTCFLENIADKVSYDPYDAVFNVHFEKRRDSCCVSIAYMLRHRSCAPSIHQSTC
ncbi:ryanodine receptor-like [Panulirus ornatus]|uniref:ryanodine receptor-like n=1 Tax=Panulirus ornatus TaxID=150431 RepID=UPI003A87D0C3